MQKIVVNNITHGIFYPERKLFVRTVNPVKHLFRIHNSYAHRMDGFMRLMDLPAEKYWLNDGVQILEAPYKELLENSYGWEDQMVLPMKLFTKTNMVVQNFAL